MNENEIFRLKGRIAISNLSREDKDMINSILDGVNKKDEEEKGYIYTVRVKLNNGKVAHATLFFKDKKGPTFEDLKSMKILKQQEKENGYNTVSLRREGVLKQLYVHRLVALAFCEKEEWKNHVDHINCIRNDNRSDNLRWCTPKENCNFPQTRINASKSLKLAMNREDVKEKLANSMKDVFSRRNVKEKMSKASILNHENGLYDHLKKRSFKIR